MRIIRFFEFYHLGIGVDRRRYLLLLNSVADFIAVTVGVGHTADKDVAVKFSSCSACWCNPCGVPAVCFRESNPAIRRRLQQHLLFRLPAGQGFPAPSAPRFPAGYTVVYVGVWFALTLKFQLLLYAVLKVKVEDVFAIDGTYYLRCRVASAPYHAWVNIGNNHEYNEHNDKCNQHIW